MTGPRYLPVGQPAPVPPELLNQRRSTLAVASMVVLGLGALVIAGLFLLSGGAVGAAVATLLAAVSFPLLIAICFWLDRYEPEPGRYRLAALGWGGVVAVFLSFVAEQLLFALPGANDFLDTAVTAPVVEEAGKGLFLLVIVLLRRSQVHGLLDGLVYAALVGIGFAFVEDILYYLSSLQEGPEALTVTFILRGVMAPFAHPLFTSATGLGVGIAVTTRRPAVRFFAPILGFVVAVVLHGIWNGSTFGGSQGFLTAYAAIMLPVLVVVLGLAIWARSREGRMLGAMLAETAARGWNPPEDVRWVARMADRRTARAYARQRGGPPAVKVLRAYQQTMTEVAFLHHRVLMGTAPPDLNPRMSGLLARAHALRPYVLVPATPPGWAGSGGVPGAAQPAVGPGAATFTPTPFRPQDPADGASSSGSGEDPARYSTPDPRHNSTGGPSGWERPPQP
ncbi:MAG: Membrane proteinase PrsW, cleaves anti-sigma factor RsiW, family [Friedmanniella sp.]|nr:Membrane proteinase PrsW, cleaves anti-sigma factor RsiW, family [Friedmanniella sp.]